MMKFYYNVNPIGLNKNLLRSTVEVLGSNYIINVDAPGFNKEDIKITLEDNVLTITAKRNKDEEKEYLLDERYYGELSRSFTLKDIKDDVIKATYVDGVLTVNVPKLTEAETKRLITIE